MFELKEMISDLQFNNEEYAYLAMTSKFEMQFRDKLAFSLFEKLQKDELYVCREWNLKSKKRRIDIGIVDSENNPKYLIEIKATNAQHGYTGLERGFLNHIRQHINSLVSQIEELRKEYPNSEIFGIMTGTHPEGIIRTHDFMVGSCYSPPQDSSLLEIRKAYSNTVIDTIKKSAGDRIEISELIEIRLGEFYRVPISLLIYLLKM